MAIDDEIGSETGATEKAPNEPAAKSEAKTETKSAASEPTQSIEAASEDPLDAAGNDGQQPAASDDESPAKKLERVLKERAEANRKARAAKKRTAKMAKTAVQLNVPRSEISGTRLRRTVTDLDGELDATVGGEPQKSPDPTAATDSSAATKAPKFDDFGLPIRQAEVIQYASSDAGEDISRQRSWSFRHRSTSRSDVEHSRTSSRASSGSRKRWSLRLGGENSNNSSIGDVAAAKASAGPGTEAIHNSHTIEEEPRTPMQPKPAARSADDDMSTSSTTETQATSHKRNSSARDFAAVHARETEAAGASGYIVSEFSHQKLTTEKTEEPASEGDEWQTMPAFAPYDIYDDDNRLIAREHVEDEEVEDADTGLGGASKGYTRVLIDDDAESATSMDDNTQYLFKAAGGTSMMDDEDEQRDTVSQMQATKDLLTEGQRIAYVGITRLHMYNMVKELEVLVTSKRLRKETRIATESMRMWAQKMMIRLYAHMDISLAEQIMIEQLSEHGVKPGDLTPALMANARVKNPMAGEKSATDSASSTSTPRTPQSASTTRHSMAMSRPTTPQTTEKSEERKEHAHAEVGEEAAEPPPPYQEVKGEELPAVRTPSQLPATAKIDIDLRWTVLCDLFLVLVADSIYDARSRVLLERMGKSLEVPWMDICKFEKKVTEALEMQQSAEKENWDEKDHMESRRKLALKRRYVFMGLATVGGGLVIGLSAGLLAPVIGAGLAAGFTTIGVTGTSGFLAGAGGAAIITSSAAASGGVIGVRAADRRTGAVRTFEYRPLHNNKRVNLIVTVSGWMTGKVDDVRLPFSTVDPVMGDIYSVLWEPEMLTSMGDTINILATEALTQGLQQLLGSTILVSLMAALQLPVVLTKLSYLIDNPWAVSLDRATMAGLILADSLSDRNLGSRPITLVGYSLGSRVIFSCLQELARKGAYGLVQNVFMFGSPIVVKQDEYMRARTVVSGRFVNGYNRNDWILGYLFRLTNGGIRRVGGLGSVEGIPGLENMDVTESVVGHMDYRTAMPRLLRECGWLVESDEFSEIEDPDPENHAQRQRELINEIEEARKELEKESKQSTVKKGGAFAFFSRKKKGEKQEWEIYEDTQRAQKAKAMLAVGGKIEDAEGNNHGILFDVDAIRAELAREGGVKEGDLEQLEQLQVRELESTLPPMKLHLTPELSPTVPSPKTTTLKPPMPALPRSPRVSLSLGGRRVTDTAVAYRTDSRPLSASRISDDRTATLGKQSSFPPLKHERSGNFSSVPSAPSAPSLPRLPGLPVGDGAGDGGISMTFESDYHYDSGGRPLESTRETTQNVQDMHHIDGGASTPKKAGSGWAAGAAAGTMAGVSESTLADPWKEHDTEDDPDFGKEQEISMTFA